MLFQRLLTFNLSFLISWTFQINTLHLANIFLYKLIKNLFIMYFAPYVSYLHRRPTNPISGLDAYVKHHISLRLLKKKK